MEKMREEMIHEYNFFDIPDNLYVNMSQVVSNFAESVKGIGNATEIVKCPDRTHADTEQYCEPILLTYMTEKPRSSSILLIVSFNVLPSSI